MIISQPVWQPCVEAVESRDRHVMAVDHFPPSKYEWKIESISSELQSRNIEGTFGLRMLLRLSLTVNFRRHRTTRLTLDTLSSLPRPTPYTLIIIGP